MDPKPIHTILRTIVISNLVLSIFTPRSGPGHTILGIRPWAGPQDTDEVIADAVQQQALSTQEQPGDHSTVGKSVVTTCHGLGEATSRLQNQTKNQARCSPSGGLTMVDLLAAAAGRVRSTVTCFRSDPSAGMRVLSSYHDHASASPLVKVRKHVQVCACVVKGGEPAFQFHHKFI